MYTPFIGVFIYTLGNALSVEGKIEEAIFHYKTAIGRKPDYTEAQKNLETALRSMEIQDHF
jgi:tetratricopeptide (TPR) repeat protein